MQTSVFNQTRPLIFGEVLFDEFPDGSRVLGGAPFNVAWHLQAFGLQPLFISALGEDEAGQQIIAAMRAWGMDLSGVQQVVDYPTGIVEVGFENGEPHYNIVSDSAWDFIRPTDLPPQLPPLSVFYHGSLALRQVVSHTTWQWLRQQTEAPRFMDINLRSPWWNAEGIPHMLEGIRWLKLNEHELQEIVPEHNTTTSRLPFLFQQQPLEWVIVTQGQTGAIAVSRDQEVLQVKPQTQTSALVDTVGAGDAFSSVVVLGLSHGWPMQQILERAQAFASAIIGIRGAMSHERSFYQPFLQDWQLT